MVSYFVGDVQNNRELMNLRQEAAKHLASGPPPTSMVRKEGLLLQKVGLEKMADSH